MDKSKEAHLINLAYILGTSLLIAAIVYFFAANWGGLERGLKVGLITLLLISFYGLCFLFTQILPLRPLIGKLALFAGVMAFGVSVALLGQLYNSHADSYLLFLVWLIPSLLFSIITRFQSFYILSYILIHLTFAFYVFPTAVSFNRTEGEIILYLLFLAALNLLLFALIRKNAFTSSILQYGSFLIFHLIWLGLTMRWVFESYALILNLSYIILLIGSLYWFVKTAHARPYIVLTSLALAAYVSSWMFSWMIDNASEWFFVLVIFLAMALVMMAIFFVKWMKKRMGQSEHREKPWWQKLLVVGVSSVSSLLATAAFIGLTSLLFNDLLSSLYVGIALALIVVVIWLGDRFDEIINHTFMNVGLLLAIVFAGDIPIILSILFMTLVPIIWNKIKNTAVRMFVYLATNLFILITAIQYTIMFEQLMLILLVLNLALLVASSLIGNNSEKVLQRNALFYTLLFGFVLTFYNDIHLVLYYLYNGGFFIVTTYLGFHYVQRNQVFRARMVLLFWFVFLFYKYYDLVWQLLHKSIALLIIGAGFLLVAILVDRRVQRNPSKQELIIRNKIPIVLVILLQLAFISYQYIHNEHVLANGELIKLELEPLDPRSLLQGDYVRLNYDISQINELTERFQPGEKVKIVLSSGEDGLYEYSGVYQYKGDYNVPYDKSEHDVLINAKANGWDGFIYGIESYFIEEGTGADVEQATHAFVRVATNGNALLVELE